MKDGFIAREAAPVIDKRAKGYPVLAVMGPRQSGKTTATQMWFPEKPYANLENTKVREFAERDPTAFLAQFPDGAILDEIQCAPNLMSDIQVIVDKADREGMFVLTGSHQLMVHEAISQPMAGRISLITLMPLSIHELQQAGRLSEWKTQIIKGFYPRIYRKEITPSDWFDDYLKTYVEREVRQLINVNQLSLFHTFLRLLAGRVGSVLNITSLCNDVGVSVSTAQSWLSLLEASYVIYKLQPYSTNRGKRLIKSPKYYFCDVGLAAYLLNIDNEDQLFRDPLRGALYENMIVMDIVKRFYHAGITPQLSFYRDSNGVEIDLLIESREKTIPVEIKSSATYHTEFTKSINVFRAQDPTHIHRGFVVYNGDHWPSKDKVSFIDMEHLDCILEATGKFDV